MKFPNFLLYRGFRKYLEYATDYAVELRKSSELAKERGIKRKREEDDEKNDEEEEEEEEYSDDDENDVENDE